MTHLSERKEKKKGKAQEKRKGNTGERRGMLRERLEDINERRTYRKGNKYLCIVQDTALG